MGFGLGTSDMDIKDVPLAAIDTMLLDHDVWALRLFRDHTMERLVHALDDLGDEWEREESRLRAQGADSECLGDAKADFVLVAIHVEQETRNTLAVSLYHLFEKQVTRFARRALCLRRMDAKGIRYLKDVDEELRRIGLDCRKFACLPTIDALRIVANIVKHGREKTRRADLAKLPRDLFRDPARVREPNRGDEDVDDTASGDFDLFVHKHHLDEWCDALFEFWKEMSSLSWGQPRLTLGSLAKLDSSPKRSGRE